MLFMTKKVANPIGLIHLSSICLSLNAPRKKPYAESNCLFVSFYEAFFLLTALFSKYEFMRMEYIFGTKFKQDHSSRKKTILSSYPLGQITPSSPKPSIHRKSGSHFFHQSKPCTIPPKRTLHSFSLPQPQTSLRLEITGDQENQE